MERYPMIYINKMARAMDRVVGKELRTEILTDCEDLKSKDKKEKRGEAMRVVMNKMGDLLSKEEIIRIREECACKPKKFVSMVNTIKKDTDDYTKRLDKLQNTGFAGVITKNVDNMLRVEFKTSKCFCGMVGKSKSNIPRLWCHCCKEHVRWLYEKVLEKEIDAKLVSAVIAGDEDCVFELNVK
ncbi:DUF6144 family protein [Dethiothermospora halolimnae]|uniref:DUF6144 family protein n=1 Tax=Dethiothermospora halolimnae TaxID=3114390 RepID=UPI003CCC143B